MSCVDDSTYGQQSKFSTKEYADLKQVTAEHKWEEQRPSVFCGYFRFVWQLVLVGSLGSFLFGFNISLLNTAVDMVCSEFQLCGRLSGFGHHLRDIIATESLEAATTFCAQNPDAFQKSGCTAVMNNNVIVDYKCPGGYTDIGCPSLKWYKAFIQTAVLIGGTVGALIAGKLVHFGRRTLLLIVMFIFCIGVVSSVCANSFSAMFWARLIVGCGVGLTSVASPTYMSEMTPRHERGKFGVVHQLNVTVGIFIGVLLGFPLPDPKEQTLIWTPSSFDQFWWRFMLGLGLVPVLIGAYMLYLVYTFETPIWYVEQSRYKDAYQILERIYETQDVKNELDVCIDNVNKAEIYKKTGTGFIKTMMNPKYFWVMFVGLGLAGFQQFGGINVFMTSSTGLFEKAGLTKGMQTGMSVLMTIINVLMTFPTMFLVEYLGRKQLLFLGSLLQFIFVLPCSIAYWTEADPENPSGVTQVLAIVAVIGFVTFFAVAFGPVVWVYLFEIFPLEIKDAASSGCTAFNWFSAIIMVFVANVVPNQVSFTLFGLLQLAATIFVLAFMKETKGIPIGVSPYMTKSKDIAVTSMA